MEVNKSVSIKGNLNHKVSYNLCPTDEFSTGQWLIGISSIAYQSSESLNICCEVTSNFTVGKKFSKNLQVEDYEEPLATFFIDTSKNLRRIRQINQSTKS